MKIGSVLAASLLLLSATDLVHGQQPDEATAPPTAETAPARSTPEVVDFYVDERGQEKYRQTLSLNDTLAVKITGLGDWVAARGASQWDLRLFVNGQILESLRPDRCVLNEGTVWFDLDRIDRSKEPAWKNLLAIRDGLETTVEISVGIAGDPKPLPTQIAGSKAPQLILARLTLLISAVVGYLFILASFVYLARRSNILRDSGPAPASGRRPYSLARVQMAWWTFLVLGAFLLISLLTGTVVPIPGVVLGLMGIASGTYLGAELIDTGKREGAGPAQPPARSLGFMRDILAVQSGVAFHRFQITVFTLVLGAYFLVEVMETLVMPQFDTSILGLMGISSGTYIGVKFPEAPKATEPTPQAAPGETAGGSTDS